VRIRFTIDIERYHPPEQEIMIVESQGTIMGFQPNPVQISDDDED
jgi:hypothetical protein